RLSAAPSEAPGGTRRPRSPPSLWPGCQVPASEALLDCLVVCTREEVFLGLVRLAALGTLPQLGAVVHPWVPRSLPGQRREEAHKLLEPEGPHVAIPGTGDVPALL